MKCTALSSSDSACARARAACLITSSSVGVREEAEQFVAQDERALAWQSAQALGDVPPTHARSGELLD